MMDKMRKLALEMGGEELAGHIDKARELEKRIGDQVRDLINSITEQEAGVSVEEHGLTEEQATKAHVVSIAACEALSAMFASTAVMSVNQMNRMSELGMCKPSSDTAEALAIRSLRHNLRAAEETYRNAEARLPKNPDKASVLDRIVSAAKRAGGSK